MTNYYAKIGGNDSLSGLDLANAWATLSTVVTRLSAGDTLWIKGGSWGHGFGFNGNTHPVGTSWVNAITIRAYENAGVPETVTLTEPGGTSIIGFHPGSHYTGVKATAYPIYWIMMNLILDGTGLIFSPANIDGPWVDRGCCVSALDVGFVRFTGCRMTKSVSPPFSAGRNWEFINCEFDSSITSHGLYVTSTDSLVEGCHIHNNHSLGVQFTDSGHYDINNSIARNNRIHNNGNIGIEMSNGVGQRIYNNLIYDNPTHGLVYGAAGNATNVEIANNTIWRNGGSGLFFGNDPAAGGGITPGYVHIKNNIIYGNAGADITDGNAANGGSVATIIVDNNMTGGIIVSCASWDEILNNKVGDPLLTNPPTDFTLQLTPVQSQAAGNGLDLSSLFTTDYAAATRTLPWDIGAYRTGSAPPPSAAISSINPTTAQQGTTVQIDIILTNAHCDGTTVVSFSGTGIVKGALTINSANSISQIITIDSGATLSARRVTVTTGSEAPFYDSLTITASSGGSAQLTDVLQNVNYPGDTDDLTGIGSGTHFNQATSVVSYSGSGVHHNSINVINATLFAANFTIDIGAAPGFRRVTVTTPGAPGGTEVVFIDNKFYINATPSPPSPANLRGAREGR